MGLSDLDFTPGLEIQKTIRDLFGATVNFSASSSSCEFFLVASFSRSALRLNCNSVAIILQSCLHGVAKDFLVKHISGLMFRFSVDSKSVGFLIYHLKSFDCAAFSVFFALWGANGPNWRKEYRSWIVEQKNELVHVSYHKKKSYAQVARDLPAGSSDSNRAHDSPASVFSRLHIPADHPLFSEPVRHDHAEGPFPDPKPKSGVSKNFKSSGSDLNARDCSLCFGM